MNIQMDEPSQAASKPFDEVTAISRECSADLVPIFGEAILSILAGIFVIVGGAALFFTLGSSSGLASGLGAGAAIGGLVFAVTSSIRLVAIIVNVNSLGIALTLYFSNLQVQLHEELAGEVARAAELVLLLSRHAMDAQSSDEQFGASHDWAEISNKASETIRSAESEQREHDIMMKKMDQDLQRELTAATNATMKSTAKWGVVGSAVSGLFGGLIVYVLGRVFP